MNANPLSRRAFLRLGAITSAGVMLVACAPAAAPGQALPPLLPPQLRLKPPRPPPRR